LGHYDERMNEDGTGGSVVPPRGKASYMPPVLVKWGTLNDITKAVGRHGAFDGGDPKYGHKTR